MLATGRQGFTQETMPALPPPPDQFFEYIATGVPVENDGHGVVKGAPYSAQSVTEITQTLNDGNQIDRKETGAVYRDSEGRTRRETSLSMVGPWSASGAPHQMIHIHDVVAGTRYLLDPQEKTAFKLPGFKDADMKLAQTLPAQVHVAQGGVATTGGPAGMVGISVKADKHVQAETTSESLGTQVMEGIEVQGTRTTETIPAGAIGNVKPINIVNERWYSPELQVYVMTKRMDPRFGETVHQLTSINRQEPAPTLFQVPADYTVKEGPVVRRFKQVMIPPPPPDSGKP
jgi:hypothetical protein